MNTSTVETSRGELFVYEWGLPTAPAVLYWDGLGGTGLHANELGPLLEALGARVIAPDAPGHGRSPAVGADGYRPSSLAASAAELLSALGVERALFLGFSWGAEVAVAFGARHPARAAGIVLVGGGYWDFADLPDFDLGQSLEAHVEAARKRAEEERYPTWDAYFAAEREALGRWTPALEDAHRATMHESAGEIVPIAGPEVVGATRRANCLEPSAGEQAALVASGLSVLLVTPEHGPGPVGRAGIERFRANVPQLEFETLPGDVHDLVSVAPDALAALVRLRLGL